MSRVERAWLGTVPRMRRERHYGDRIVCCFVERPRNAYDLLREAAARNPEGEACVNERMTYRELSREGATQKHRRSHLRQRRRPGHLTGTGPRRFDLGQGLPRAPGIQYQGEWGAGVWANETD